MVEHLPSCPFCATNEHLSFQWPGSMTPDMPDRPCRVVCTHIDHDTVVGPTAYGKAAAIAAWSRRPDLAALSQPSPDEGAGEPVGEVVMFGGDLKEISWKKGKLPSVGTKLYAAPPPSDDSLGRLREALAGLLRMEKSIKTDVSSAHSGRGAGASSWMREDDRDFRDALDRAFDAARAALALSQGEAGNR